MLNAFIYAKFFEQSVEMRRLLILCAVFSTVAQEWQSPNHVAKYGRAFINTKEFKWGASQALVKRANQLASDEQDIYQFGVYTGGTMTHMNIRIKSYRRMWGFDSFEGLPPETYGVRIEGKHWLPGGFSSKGALKAKTPEEAMRRVAAKLDNPKATLVRGFFNNSLPTMDLSACRPALLVDIDSDLYACQRSKR